MFYVACGVKLQGIATRRQVIWSLCLDPLLGRDEVTRTNRGRRRHKRSRTFLLIFPSRMPGKIFRKNSDSPRIWRKLLHAKLYHESSGQFKAERNPYC
jgi:hypothetical protein